MHLNYDQSMILLNMYYNIINLFGTSYYKKKKKKKTKVDLLHYLLYDTNSGFFIAYKTHQKCSRNNFLQDSIVQGYWYCFTNLIANEHYDIVNTIRSYKGKHPIIENTD